MCIGFIRNALANVRALIAFVIKVLFVALPGLMTLGAILEIDRLYRADIGVAHALSWTNVLLLAIILVRNKIHFLYRNAPLRWFLILGQMAFIGMMLAGRRNRVMGATAAFAYMVLIFRLRKIPGSGELGKLFAVVQLQAVVKPPKPARPEKKQQQPKVSGGIVCIEGNICSGKSTLCRDVKRLATVNNFEIHLEEVPAALHAAFIEEPSHYGFPLQMLLCERRIGLIKSLSVDHRDDRVALVDRSLMGDYAFAAWNYIIGAISNKQFSVYQDQFAKTPTDLMNLAIGGTRPPRVVALLTPAKECRARLDKRDGCDKNTTIEYLTGVSIMHIWALAHRVRRWHCMDVTILMSTKRLATPESANSFITKAMGVHHNKAPIWQGQSSDVKLLEAQLVRAQYVADQLFGAGDYEVPDELDEKAQYEHLLEAAVNHK